LKHLIGNTKIILPFAPQLYNLKAFPINRLQFKLLINHDNPNKTRTDPIKFTKSSKYIKIPNQVNKQTKQTTKLPNNQSTDQTTKQPNKQVSKPNQSSTGRFQSKLERVLTHPLTIHSSFITSHSYFHSFLHFINRMLHPTVKFAQRSDSLFVTIELMDVIKESAVIELGPKSLSFKGKSRAKEYEVKLDLYGDIEDKNPDTKFAIKPREVSFYLKKAAEGYWPRLLSDKGKQKAHVKIDFDRWKDEDEEDEAPMSTSGMEGLGGGGGGGGGGFDFAKMQQMSMF
jgi:prostaglandin-E synthase